VLYCYIVNTVVLRYLLSYCIVLYCVVLCMMLLCCVVLYSVTLSNVYVGLYFIIDVLFRENKK
jgi:hypothetical protein